MFGNLSFFLFVVSMFFLCMHNDVLHHLIQLNGFQQDYKGDVFEKKITCVLLRV